MSLSIRFQLAISSLLQNHKARKTLKGIKKQVGADLATIASLPTQQSQASGTLIVKCDDIGDFLVWQQVIPTIVEHAPKPLVLVANSAIKPIVENFFDFADTYIWIDKKQWGNASYRLSIYQQVRQIHPVLAFSPLFTRNFVMDDLILAASDATKRFVWHRQHHAYFPDMDLLDAHTGTQVSSLTPIKLEYLRNMEFVSKVFNVPLNEEVKVLFPDFKKYRTLIVVPVASAGSKTWSAENFARTISAVINDFDKCILIAGPNGVEAAAQICQLAGSPKIINLVNQTQLNEAFAFIGEASVLLTLDTFASHIGVLTATNTVLISNGTNWQRFANYAPYVSSAFVSIMPPHINPNSQKVKIRYNSAEINTIKVETVVRAIKQLIA